MLKKNLVKIFILTLKMCDLANKPVPTAASPSVANSWQNILASLVIKYGLCAKNFSPSKINFLGLFLSYKLGQNPLAESFSSHFFSTLFELCGRIFG